ncbi:MAG: LysR family transcriptional regulator [Alphaproteobacteria bacterium]
MDVTLARTFLEVVATGNFISAAERLHVTQSTVSMRIKSLEEQLGQILFSRSKAGANLTPAGQHFQRHAATMVRVWEQARYEVSLPAGHRALLTVGGQFSLWDRLLLRWLPWMRAEAPDIALRAEVGLSDGLMTRLVEGTLDIGVMYTPQSRPGLRSFKLLEENLVLAGTRSDIESTPGPDYVYVDWGPEFQANHAMHFPDVYRPGLSVGLGALALSYILESGGSGYFPKRVIRSYLADKKLYLAPDAPVFHRPAYVVYPETLDPELVEVAVRGLKHVAGSETED